MIHIHLVFLSILIFFVYVGFVQANQCNNVFGCLEEEQFERCTCYRDCGYDGEPVCGSDGQLYQNQCQMEVFACRNGTRIKQVPLSQCPHSKSSLIAQHLTSPGPQSHFSQTP
uniref:Kazal-like domain-containing protein n=1 Tax=Seriola lalandi dorsalis TaxID=1841481 RepID=A0A3B4WSX9_SERLL